MELPSSCPLLPTAHLQLRSQSCRRADYDLLTIWSEWGPGHRAYGETWPETLSLCPVCGRVWRDGDHVTCRHHSPHSLTRPVAATVDRWYLAATIWPLLHRNHLPPLASHSSHTTFGYWDLIFRVWSSQQTSPPRCHSQRVTVRLYEIWDIIWRYNVLILDKYLFSGGTRHQPQPSRQINLTCHECSATILSTVFIHVKYLDISMVLINGPVMDSTCSPSTNTKYQISNVNIKWQTLNIKWQVLGVLAWRWSDLELGWALAWRWELGAGSWELRTENWEREIKPLDNITSGIGHHLDYVSCVAY